MMRTETQKIMSKNKRSVMMVVMMREILTCNENVDRSSLCCRVRFDVRYAPNVVILSRK